MKFTLSLLMAVCLAFLCCCGNAASLPEVTSDTTTGGENMGTNGKNDLPLIDPFASRVYLTVEQQEEMLAEYYAGLSEETRQLYMGIEEMVQHLNENSDFDGLELLQITYRASTGSPPSGGHSENGYV